MISPPLLLFYQWELKFWNKNPNCNIILEIEWYKNSKFLFIKATKFSNIEFKYDGVLFTYEFHLYEILVVINNII